MKGKLSDVRIVHGPLGLLGMMFHCIGGSNTSSMVEMNWLFRLWYPRPDCGRCTLWDGTVIT